MWEFMWEERFSEWMTVVVAYIFWALPFLSDLWAVQQRPSSESSCSWDRALLTRGWRRERDPAREGEEKSGESLVKSRSIGKVRRGEGRRKNLSTIVGCAWRKRFGEWSRCSLTNNNPADSLNLFRLKLSFCSVGGRVCCCNHFAICGAALSSKRLLDRSSSSTCALFTKKLQRLRLPS